MSNASGVGGNLDELLTLKQVAKRLQVCPKTVRRIIGKYDIPLVKVGARIRIPAHSQLSPHFFGGQNATGSWCFDATSLV
jgi:excisionase family DNA binding protein